MREADEQCAWRAASAGGSGARARLSILRSTNGGSRAVDSRFKCDTELTGKCLQGGLEGEAFAGRGVESPEQGIEVGVAVA